MSEWQPISTAPKDGTAILVFGRLSDHPDDMVRFPDNGIYTAYFDAIDRAFCASAATWTGPFINATHWQSLPTPPEAS